MSCQKGSQDGSVDDRSGALREEYIEHLLHSLPDKIRLLIRAGLQTFKPDVTHPAA